MHNEFTAIVQKDGDWYQGTAQKCQALMDRARQRKSAVRTWPRRLRSFLRTGGRMLRTNCQHRPLTRQMSTAPELCTDAK